MLKVSQMADIWLAMGRSLWPIAAELSWRLGLLGVGGGALYRPPRLSRVSWQRDLPHNHIIIHPHDFGLLQDVRN